MLVRGASLLLRCSHRAAARPRSLGGSGFSRQRVGMAASRTQAASEAAHCWNVAKRWEGFLLQDGTEEGSVPVHLISPAEVASLEDPHGAAAAALAGLNSFKGKSGELLLVPDAQGKLQSVLLGLGEAGEAGAEPWAFAGLPTKLPPGTYSLQLKGQGKAVPAADAADGEQAQAAGGASASSAGALPIADRAALGFALGCYSFDRYKKAVDKEGQPLPPKVQAKLVWPQGSDKSLVGALASAYFWARDLINTPAEDLGPQHLALEALALAAAHGAKHSVIEGDELLDAGYPAVHTVGRAAARPPALVDLRWEPAGAANAADLPLLALVGKGVCFDSGGLDIKTAAGMKWMKKDMGGAALMLALAHVVMLQQLPVRLRVLVPCVENAISGNAYRPLDVLRTRAGITVENGNTDAEGRLILCDALYEASTESPDLIIDAATLTGAARVALGPDVPVVFSSCDATWAALSAAAAAQGEYLWRMPLHAPYRKMLDSKVADIASTGGEGAQGGAILAALYLQEFVKGVPRWVHIDTAASVGGGSAGPGKPEGGEAQGLRALWAFLSARYAAAGVAGKA